MFSEFKKFILRGNVVDLAVGVVMGVAFGAIVNALVKDLITPIFGAIGGKPDFSQLVFTINGSQFMYGDFLNSVISFLIIATVVFFFIVHPINKLQTIYDAKNKKEETSKDRKCPECLSKVPKEATRCMYCTSKLEPVKSKDKPKKKLKTSAK